MDVAKYRPISSIVVDGGTLRVYANGLVTRLSLGEFEIFHMLWQAKTPVLTSERMIARRDGHKLACDLPTGPLNLLKAVISDIRARVRPLGIDVKCDWGVGYHLTLRKLSDEEIASSLLKLFPPNLQRNQAMRYTLAPVGTRSPPELFSK